ncbi:MAG: RecX family transcriptional regulator [Proteobacteria bacterium]|nr:RecX family transcriptional regulator [Pseudomonadota bacterium]
MTEPQRPARKSAPRKMTPRRLENIARFYIERFATTSAHLRRVLSRRAERARRVHGGEAAEMNGWIEEVVARLVRLGLVNDARYAADRAASLRRLGRGPGRIRALLAAKGVPRAMIENVLKETAETDDGEDASLNAAVAYAKRRRFGAYGKAPADKEERAKKQKKELAALGRAGFAYAIARKALAGDAE